MRKIIRKILPAKVLEWHWKYFKSKQTSFENKTHDQVFTEIFRKKYWGDDESVSGIGSSVLETNKIRLALPEVLRELGIKSMLDIPCGDFYWMQTIDLSGIQYTGADIVAELAAENNAKYKTNNISFTRLDIANDPLPKVDLIFCRDCLVHLNEGLVLAALKNIKKSGSKYLLTTSYPETTTNENIVTGNWRALNLEIVPFGLPKPLKAIPDTVLKPADKVMALWKIEDLP